MLGGVQQFVFAEGFAGLAELVLERFGLGRDAEKTIIVNGKTVIRKFRDALKSADLKVNDSVVVVGDPNEEGQIEAKLIRVFDPKGAEETKTRSWFGF